MTRVIKTGERIKNKRKEFKLTQGNLAELAEVSPITVFRWEAGDRSPRAEELQKLAEALNTTSAYLLGETDDPRPAASKGEAETKAQAQTEPEQLLIEDKGAGYKDVSASRGVLEYEFKDGRKIKLPDTSDNRAFFQEIVRGDLKQLAY